MILHILRREEWAAAVAEGRYAPASLATEGFIHCSTAAQVAETANRFFCGQRDLVILCIDEERLTSTLKYEAAAMPGHERTDAVFPHLYGPLEVDAVVQVSEFPCDHEGKFALPEGLQV